MNSTINDIPQQLGVPINILLADDDKDDRFFFKNVLSELLIPTQLTTVEDGQKLMDYLAKNYSTLPDVLFLDLNMPCKNGGECLEEIKANKKLQSLPVIIYSTSLHDTVADELYEKGAHYYVRKTDLTELKTMLQSILTMMQEKKFIRPARNKFVFGSVKVWKV